MLGWSGVISVQA
jgi:hypothetical protein